MLIRSLPGIALAVFAAGAAYAQDQDSAPLPSDAPRAMPREAAPPPVSARETTTYDTRRGELVVHTSQPGPPDFGPAPPFDTLANGKSYITQDDAAGYGLLANDFIYADSNRDGRISQSEYDRWARAR